MRVACWIRKATRAQKHPHADAPGRTHARTYACTHIHREICNTYWFSSGLAIAPRCYVVRTLPVLLFDDYVSNVSSKHEDINAVRIHVTGSQVNCLKSTVILNSPLPSASKVLSSIQFFYYNPCESSTSAEHSTSPPYPRKLMPFCDTYIRA